MSTSTRPSLLETQDAEPMEVYDRLREIGDVVWDEQLNAWLVTSYDLVRRMSQADKGLWRSVLVWTREAPTMGLDEQTWIDVQGGSAKHMFLIEGREHELMHKWWLRTLSSRALARWEEALMHPVAHAQIDRFAAQGRAELVSQYADRVAPRVICAIMGLPWEDDAFIDKMIELPGRVVDLLQTQAETGSKEEAVQLAVDAARQLNEHLMPYVMERRSGEGDDFISMLWRDAEDIFGPDYAYTPADICVQASTAFGAATETTASATANGLYLLMTRPGLADTVREAGSEGIRSFIEESLRLYTPVTHRPRLAMEDITLGDVTIKKGEMAIAVLQAGGTDPRHYEHPLDIDLHRKIARDHFAFYRGERVCPGHQLARLELAVIFETAIERLRNLRLDPDADAPRYKALLVRRWEPLHALFDA